MNDNEYVARVIEERLKEGTAAVLATIVSVQGSSPRHAGSKMVIAGNGQCYGTVGGSLLEATVIQAGRSILAGAQSRLMDFDLTGENAAAPGMICGGRAVVLLEYIPATPENAEFFSALIEAIKTGQDLYFLTRFHKSADKIDIAGHAILFADGRFTGTQSWTDRDIETLKLQLLTTTETAQVALGETVVVADPFLRVKTVYCFGAGHVAVPTVHIAALVGFPVEVFDDRSEFASRERFPEARAVHVIEDFNAALAGLPIDADSYIVILTRGHKFDREVLEQALRTQAGYIGMISSRKKKEAIYAALLAQGVPQTRLDQVHSPIGIPLGGETPEEIAVSIVAELIRARAQSREND